jgi:hypothetical protein
MGSHHVFVADIVSVSVREEIIDTDGKLRFDKADLLAYAHGEYYALGEVVGRFGFSTDKPQKKSFKKAPPKQEKKTEDAKKSAYVPPKEDKKSAEETVSAVPFYKNLPRSIKRKSPSHTKKGSKK